MTQTMTWAEFGRDIDHEEPQAMKRIGGGIEGGGMTYMLYEATYKNHAAELFAVFENGDVAQVDEEWR